MAQRKVLYIDSNGLPAEHSESADSIKLSSLLTANYELTDTRLGNLIGGNDGSNEHTHDSVYFTESEHINVSAGAGDAGKPIKLDASGLVDSSMLDLSGLDHGGLSGLADDDHTQYSLADGTRAYTGKVSYSSHPTFSADTEIVDKKYVDDTLLTSEWYPLSAKDYVVDNTLAPATEVLDDVYVLSDDGGSPNAAWDGAAAGDIVQFNGTSWVATTPSTGTRIGVDDEPSVAFYLFGGATWEPKYEESTTASTGLVKVGFDLRIDSSAGGDGLGFAAGVLSVNVDDATIETNADTLRVKADGVNDTHIDFGVGANQVSAVDIPIADAGGYYATDEVEFALQQLGEEVLNGGLEYTVGTGGIDKGDLAYISSTNTVLPYGTLSQSHRGIGIALTTEIASASVKVLANDTKVSGLTFGGAPSVGDPIYWDGSGLTATIPSGSGTHVWQAGVMAAAGVMHVEVRFVKKNA